MLTLPDEYLQYFKSGSLTEGSLSIEPGWFQLWAPENVEQLNKDYHVDESLPEFLGFGSNGGGELFVFDAIGRVLMVPFIVMSPQDARVIAGSWGEFVKQMES